jgi:hypothetical protein
LPGHARRDVFRRSDLRPRRASSPLAESTGYVAPSAGERRDGHLLVVEHLEDADQMGHRQQLARFQVDVQQLDLAVLRRCRRLAPDQLAQAGRVDDRHVLEVDHDLGVTILELGEQRAAQRDIARADRELAAQVQNRDACDLSFHDLHRQLPELRRHSIHRQAMTRYEALSHNLRRSIPGRS